MPANFHIGMMARRELAPEDLIPFVQRADAAGFDEIWLVEDCFFAGGVASTAAALAATSRAHIGLGIMPAVARNPAFTAMEIAALDRLFPGRFLPGLGHGVTDWMKQIGAFPASQLAALEETTAVVRALLHGDTVDFDGQHVHLRDVRLEFPPRQPPPVSLGVRGPRSLQLSGRVADGTLLAECAAPAYIAWAREHIQAGQREAGRDGQPHRLTVYAHYAFDDERGSAFSRLRPLLAQSIAHGGNRAQLEPLGILPDADRLLAEGGQAALERDMPDDWIAQLAIAGDPAQCRDAVLKLVAAGADSIVLVPTGEDTRALDTAASVLLPLLA